MADKPHSPGGTPEFDTGATSTVPTAVLVLVLLAIFLAFVGAASIVFFPKVSPEQAQLEADAVIAAEIVQFSESVETAVLRMNERGLHGRDMDFSIEATGEMAVFSVRGGNLAYRPAPQLAENVRPSWEFKKPLVDGSGWYVTGVGRDDIGGADVIMTLEGLPRSICVAVNRRLGHAGKREEKIFEQRAQTQLSTPAPPDRVTPEASIAAAPGTRAACIKNGAAGEHYFFYRVLEAY
jgi:hypothetical protein